MRTAAVLVIAAVRGGWGVPAAHGGAEGGTGHTYWRLVRSVRRGGKVVQETVAHLGELDGEGRARARLLAQEITGRADQRELFEATAPGEPAVAVRLEGIRVERGRALGDVWLGWTLWRALRLEELCAALLPPGRAAVPWAQMAAVLVIARLCEPSSELHIAEDWYRTTAQAVERKNLALDREDRQRIRLYRLSRLRLHFFAQGGQALQQNRPHASCAGAQPRYTILETR